MLAKQLELALKLTQEEHSTAFERFANGFLVHDYPELEAIGGKKDRGIDARVVAGDSGNGILVVQSCVSPQARARTKILSTIEKLKGNIPPTFVYCTSATVGITLDETKTELRQRFKTVLEVCDAPWFVQRVFSSEDRIRLCEAYAADVLRPLLEDVAPDKLYSEILSDAEERIATQYLEAHSLDRARGRNLTKALFDALIMFVLRDSDPQEKLLAEEDIIESICTMFPTGHRTRIGEITRPRIQHLVSKDILKHHQKDDRYALSYAHRERLKGQLSLLEQREIAFRASLKEAVSWTIETNEIDYECDAEHLIQVGHNCLLWYMREQGRQLQDPVQHLLNLMNTEELVSQYLARGKVKLNNPQADHTIVMDILPTAIYRIITSKEPDIRSYLRSKSDVFVVQAFLQSTPDVQKACAKLFGRDVIYVDTTVLIHCTAELYSVEASRQLISTLDTARKLNIKIKTFRSFVQEFVAHLKGPVLLEWLNHFQGAASQTQMARLNVAPKLIRVFSEFGALYGGTVSQIVHDIVGSVNMEQNAIEFLQEEFGIMTEDVPSLFDDSDRQEWQSIFGIWLGAKRQSPRMSQDRFELLVRNDTNSYVGIRTLRRDTKMEGENYGPKIWMLTLDRMYWRIPELIDRKDDFSYHVAMSMDYLANFVATLASMSSSIKDDFSLPATLITEENAFIPRELQEIATAEWQKNAPKYIKVRKIRELVHKTKTYLGGLDLSEDLSDEFDVPITSAGEEIQNA